MTDAYRELVHRLIVWVRYLRRIKAVKYSVFAFLLALMLLGVTVATTPMQGVQINDKFIHIVVFFGFAFIIDLVTSREPFWLWKGLPLIVYGFGIEVLQYFSPDRSFSLFDGLADGVGVLLYWLAKQLLYLYERRRLSQITKP